MNILYKLGTAIIHIGLVCWFVLFCLLMVMALTA